MKFCDHIEIRVQAGDGGKGLVSFRAVRNRPKMGADGGDGGFGGDVYLQGNGQLNTLSMLRFRQLYSAEHGAAGGPNNRTGATGESMMIKVPLGTEIYDVDTHEKIGEVLAEGQKILVAKGGERGLGNYRFLSATHQAPEENTEGTPGEIRNVQLELKLIADVGFAGLPNAGKSTLLSQLSSARPKIADYPFTTLVPHLGVVDVPERGEYGTASFVAADIPGLIAGASEGKGLGHDFLRHLERTQILVFLLDGGTEVVTEDGVTGAADAFDILVHELSSFGEELLNKPRVVVLNKLDLLSGKPWPKKLLDFMTQLKEKGITVLEISAATGQGVSELRTVLFDLLAARKAEQLALETPQITLPKISDRIRYDFFAENF